MTTTPPWFDGFTTHRITTSGAEIFVRTGGTVGACVKLLEKTGANIVGCAFAIELVGLGGSKAIEPHPVFSLIKY